MMSRGIKIHTRKQAATQIQAAAAWLKTYTEQEDAENSSAEGEDKSAELARVWCEVLLDASRADGLGGCRLCQS